MEVTLTYQKSITKINIMNEILQTLTEEQRKAVDWMIEGNLRSFCDSVKSGDVNPNTTIAKIFYENGIKVTA